MSKTVVGLFNSTAAAQQVRQALITEGYDASSIKIVANDHDDDFSSTSTEYTEGNTNATDATGTGSTTGSSTGTGIGDKISSFFRSLVGGDEDAHAQYASGVNEGGALLTVTTDDEDAAEVAGMLRQRGAREIQGGSQQTGVADTSYRDRTGGNVTGETAIPVVEEELVVGKREVDRGGVRVYSHVVERPAEADVTLRDERIKVERRAVNRPATSADFQTGGDSFELRASGEEAVIAKNSRVVEEVLIGKDSGEHTEAVRDTVRKTEVEVEEIPGEITTEKNRY